MTSRVVLFLVAAVLLTAAVMPSVSAASFGEPTDDGYTYMGTGWNPSNTYVACYGLTDGSYDGRGYLKWDLSSVAPGTYTVTSASITIIHTPNPLWNTSQSALYPLEFVDVGSGWSEASSGASLPASGNTVFGSASYTGTITADEAFPWTINLDPAAFTGYFNSAVAEGELNLVARSLLPVESMAYMMRYMWYSNQDATFPGAVLNVNYAPVPEPGSLLAMLTGLTGMAGLLPRLRRKSL